MYITKIRSNEEGYNSKTIGALKDSIECAKFLGDKKSASICQINLGILEGSKKIEIYGSKDFDECAEYENG